jgi:hypothetical protein
VAIANVKVRRLERLADMQALLSERRQQLGFPHAGMEIPGLAISGPVPVRIGESEVELVQYPRGQMMRRRAQGVEDGTGGTALKVVKACPWGGVGRQRFGRRADAQQGFKALLRMLERSESELARRLGPDVIDATPHGDDAEFAGLGMPCHDPAGGSLRIAPGADGHPVAETVPGRQGKGDDAEHVLRNKIHFRIMTRRFDRRTG